MPAPKGHEKWGNPLKPKSYSPDELWDKALDYFKWCDENPWLKNEAIKSGDYAGQLVKIPTQRPYTVEGFCLFADISMQTFINYTKTSGYETHFEVSKRIRELIMNQQLEGGLVGAFNPMLAARKLGLTDKQEIDHTTKGDKIQSNSIDYSKLSDAALREIANASRSEESKD